jgi:competence protein ComEA
MSRTFKWNAAWLCIGLTLTPTVAGVGADQKTLPDGEGKELVRQVCASNCHGAWFFIDLKQDRESWTEVVKDMAEMMVEAKTKRELETIINYLTTNFGPETAATEKVHVNTATAKELEASLSLSAKEADAIVHYREQNGNFKSWEDLEKVPELGTKKLEEKKNRLAY